ncbi:hypothetical protein KSS87_022195 [Heliosperma pusillum]|nr:hypothetical protein KSS87_006667 [Heliosperma pusillum]KAH9613014.1 hypothetical protein KSS87_022195 [Heliosperma pusillum]
MEHDLERLRLQLQGLFTGGGIDHHSHSGSLHSGIVAFEMQYGQWVEEQMKQVSQLRNALNTCKSDYELRILVDTSMKHYNDLSLLKAAAAKADVFYLMSGMWKTSSERVFLWLGGVRPSEFLKILLPQLDPLTELQLMDVWSLKQSCEMAEEALSQGLEKLRQRLAESVAENLLEEGNYRPGSPEMTNATDKLEALNCFVSQVRNPAANGRILTTQQAASGLVALGEYFQRLRTLSSCWSSLPLDSRL